MWRQYYPTNKTQLIQNQSLLTKKTIEGLQESIINTKAVRFEAYDLLSVMTSIGACKRGTPSMRECHAGRESVWFIPARYTVRDTSKRYKFYGIFDRTQKGGPWLRNVWQILFEVIIGLIFWTRSHWRGCIAVREGVRDFFLDQVRWNLKSWIIKYNFVILSAAFESFGLLFNLKANQ